MASTRGNSTIIPCLRYRNAHVAIDWLCDSFGFQRHAVYADERTVHHAQLAFNGSMVMLGSTDSISDEYVVNPRPGDGEPAA